MKLFREIHLWLSVPFGIIVTLICFSGAMLIFEPEITRLARSEVYTVSPDGREALPMEQLMEGVKATLPDSVEITGVTVFENPARAYQVNLSKPRRASLFVNQYTGEITGRYERLGFYSVMFKLHRWLLDSANPHGDGVKVGKTLVGVSTLVFVIALITGVVLWVPRVRKKPRKFLTISFAKGWSGFWKGLHVVGGMYALVFVLAMALTGLTWSFDWYRSGFYAVCGVEHTPRNFGQSAPAKPARDGDNRPEGRGEGFHGEGHRGEGNRGEGRRGGRGNRGEGNRGEGRRGGEGFRGKGNRAESNQGEGFHGEWRRRSEFARWQQVYDQLAQANPSAPQITVGPETATVTLGTAGNGRAADKYTFSRRDGELTLATPYADTLPADKLRGWIYSIHTGGLGGLFTRVLWFLAALMGASLPLTGYYIWIRHLRKPKDKEHRHA